jgi:hypothetical protein
MLTAEAVKEQPHLTLSKGGNIKVRSGRSASEDDDKFKSSVASGL